MGVSDEYADAKANRMMALLEYVYVHDFADEEERQYVALEIEDIGGPELGDAVALICSLAIAAGHFARLLLNVAKDAPNEFLGLAQLTPRDDTREGRASTIAAQVLVRAANGENDATADLVIPHLLADPEIAAPITIDLLLAYRSFAHLQIERTA